MKEAEEASARLLVSWFALAMCLEERTPGVSEHYSVHLLNSAPFTIREPYGGAVDVSEELGQPTAIEWDSHCYETLAHGEAQLIFSQGVKSWSWLQRVLFEFQTDLGGLEVEFLLRTPTGKPSVIPHLSREGWMFYALRASRS